MAEKKQQPQPNIVQKKPPERAAGDPLRPNPGDVVKPGKMKVSPVQQTQKKPTVSAPPPPKPPVQSVAKKQSPVAKTPVQNPPKKKAEYSSPVPPKAKEEKTGPEVVTKKVVPSPQEFPSRVVEEVVKQAKKQSDEPKKEEKKEPKVLVRKKPKEAAKKVPFEVEEKPQKLEGKKKIILLGVLSTVFVVALGVGIYLFFIKPKASPVEEETVIEEVVEEETVTEETEEETYQDTTSLRYLKNTFKDLKDPVTTLVDDATFEEDMNLDDNRSELE